jgi:hypothetical protein
MPGKKAARAAGMRLRSRTGANELDLGYRASNDA